MNAYDAVEKFSLALLVKRSIDQEALKPLLATLKSLILDEKGAVLVSQLADVVFSKDAETSFQTFEQALKITEALAAHVDKQSGKTSATVPQTAANKKDGPKSNVEQLSYDASHGQDILDSFFSEVSGHLQVVEETLIHLEHNRSDREALNAVFGAMHSLKGIMGFLDVRIGSLLAHEAEAVMELARKRAEGITRAECDAILKAVDALREIETRILNHHRNSSSPLPQVPEECNVVVALLRALPRSVESAPVAPAQGTTPATFPMTAAQTTETSETEVVERTRVLERSGLVRVKVDKLDSLMEAIGELVIVQAQVNQDSAVQSIASQRLLRNLSQLNKITRDLQGVAMALRMYPLRDLFGRMTRLARDVAQRQQKEIEVAIVGDDTELDKNIIESLVDPLTHLVRNAIDHGIDRPEARTAAGKPACARLTISAHHQSGNVVIQVSDDGRGLNFEKIAARARERALIDSAETPTEARLRNLIFEPGFSTADRVTDLSGRGVGLDVVRKNIQSLGGRVAVDSVPGQSTTFALSVPLTLAIIDGLIVRTGSERYILPITSVIESVRPAREQISTVQEQGELINVRGSFLPMIRLSEFTGIVPAYIDPAQAIVVIIECAGERCGLMVDELLGQQQVVIRSLGQCLQQVRGVASGAILGDGRVGLILDVPQILQIVRETTRPVGSVN